MPMLGGRTNGSTGAAINTIFFSKLADRFNMLSPWHLGSGARQTIQDSQFPANFVSQWSPHNPFAANAVGPNTNGVSFGAMTVAPDGSTTAQKVVEAVLSPADIHACMAGFLFPASNATHRVAVFAKAAERTRIVLTLEDPSSFPNGSGCRTVFDLAGGQIGVANTVFGTFHSPAFITGPASITPYGNGWYLCVMDATLTPDQSSNIVWTRFILDAGSGTAAENSNYAGDGTSGVYAWRATSLPPAAWAMNTRTFFEDFTDPTMANIDLLDTRNPGFRWYIHNAFPNVNLFSGLVASTASQFSQSGSNLTIDLLGAPDQGLNLMTACSVGPSFAGAPGQATVSFAPHPPFLSEIKYAMTSKNTPNQVFGSAIPLWSTPIERLVALNDHVGPAGEWIPNEWNQTSDLGPRIALLAVGTGVNQIWSGTAYPGYMAWQSSASYSTGVPTQFAGQVYQALVPTTPGHQPPSFPGEWQHLNPGPPNQPPLSGTVMYDPTVQNVYSGLLLPATPTSLGFQLPFLNGIYCSPTFLISNSTGGVHGYENAFARNYGNRWPIIIAGGRFCTMAVDWVSITQ